MYRVFKSSASIQEIYLYDNDRERFEEVAFTPRLAAAVSESPTVNEITAVATSSNTVWGWMVETVGAEFALTNARPELFAAFGSLEVAVTVARFVTIPAAVGVTTMAMVTSARLAMEPSVQVTVLPLREQLPWAGVADT